MGKPLFIKGAVYKMRHSLGYSTQLVIRDYNYLGNRGFKHHFYDPFNGVDLLLSKDEANGFIEKAKEVSNG